MCILQASVDNTNGRDGFKFAVTTRNQMSTTVMEAWHSRHLRLAPTCNNKWNAIFGDFKWINDCQKGTWHA
jgi:hypothetical protein